MLDEVLPGQSPQEIEQSIRDPEQRISPGFEDRKMPPFSETEIPEQNLRALVQYLIDSVGGAGK